MDVRLPDGRVVTNVPEGTTQAELMARLQAAESPTRMVGAMNDLPTNAPPGQSFFDEQPPRNMAQEIAGSPVTRFALGAASPAFAASQLVDQGMKAVLPENAYQVMRPELARAYEKVSPLVEQGRTARGDTGMDLPRMAGSVMGPGPLAAMKVPMATTLGGKAAQGAAMGGVFGLGSPVEPDEEFLPTKAQQVGTGAALGGVIPPVISGGASALRGARNLADPWLPGGVDRMISRTANKAAGGKRQDVLNALTQNRQIVPGSQAGAGEVAAPAGSPEFSALQRIAADLKPAPYRDMEKAQEAARAAAIRTVGQDKAKLEAAKALRAENAAEAYGRVRNDLISPQSETQIMDDAIRNRFASRASALQDQGRFSTTAAEQTQLANRFTPVEGMPRIPARYSPNIERVPEAEAAARSAGNVAALRLKEQEFLESTMDLLKQTVGLEERSLSSLLSRPSMRVAVKDAIKSAEETGTYFPKTAGQKFSVANLQRMKQALDDAVKDPAAFGIKATEAKEIMGTREAFVKWLSSRSPGWKEARLQYIEDSLPINRMQIGQELEKALTSPLEGKGERATVFANAVREAPRTIKRSTGSSIYDDIAQALTPPQTQTVRDVGQDLSRRAEYEDLARRGTPAARDLIGDIAPKAPAAGMFNPKYSVARALINRLSGKVSGKALEELALKMQDPQEMARLMQLSPPQRRAVIEALAQQAGRAVTIAGSQYEE